MSKTNNQQRKALAKAARKRRNKQTETPAQINLPDESKDLVEAANIGKTSDQAAADPTINTASADPTDPPPIVSYDGPQDADDVIVEPPTDEPAADVEAPPERSPTNEELIAQAMAKHDGDDVPFEQGLADITLEARRWFATTWQGSCDNVKKAHDWVVDQWIAGGAYAGRQIDAFYGWCNDQNQRLAAEWSKRFPPVVTKEYLSEYIDDRFGELAEILSGSYKEQADTNVRLARQIAQLQKMLQGDAPRTVSADKLDDYTDAIRRGENTKATTMYAALTGATLKDAKAAVSAFEPA